MDIREGFSVGFSMLANEHRFNPTTCDEALALAAQVIDFPVWSVETLNLDGWLTAITGEPPWEPFTALRALTQRLEHVPNQILINSQKLIGYILLPDEITVLGVETLAKNGARVFRIYDDGNDPERMFPAVRAVRRIGKHAQGTIIYDPHFSIDETAAYAAGLVDIGCHSIAISDPTASLDSSAAQALVAVVKLDHPDIPLAFFRRLDSQHDHSVAAAAVYSGVDILFVQRLVDLQVVADFPKYSHDRVSARQITGHWSIGHSNAGLDRREETPPHRINDAFLRTLLCDGGHPLDPSDLCFLVGAGASVAAPTSLPMARELVAAILQACRNHIDTSMLRVLEKSLGGATLDLPKMLEHSTNLSWNNLRFETVLNALRLSGFDPDLRILLNYSNPHGPNEIHQWLATCVSAGAHILTTNFDSMIEQALGRDIGYQYIPTLRSGFQASQVTSNLPTLAKLHGTLSGEGGHLALGTLTADLSTIELSLPPALRVVDGPPAIESVVTALVAQRTLIILGYSLGDDFDILPALMRAPELKQVIWIHHDGQARDEFFLDPLTDHDPRGFRASGRDDLWVRLRQFGVPIHHVRGDSLKILRAITSVLGLAIERSFSPQTSPAPNDAFNVQALESIYSGRNSIDWAFLLAVLLTTSNQHHLAAALFATIYGTVGRQTKTTLHEEYLKDCYLDSSWSWDYLYNTPLFQSLSTDDQLEPPPPDIPLHRYQVYRCTYHKCRLAAMNLTQTDESTFRPLSGASDDSASRIRALGRELINLEYALEANPSKPILAELQYLVVRLTEFGSVRLACRAMLAFGRLSKKLGLHNLSLPALSQCICWSRATGDNLLFTESLFEIALSSLFLTQDDIAYSDSQVPFPFHDVSSHFDVLIRVRDELAKGPPWFFLANSYSWFYELVLDSMLPAYHGRRRTVSDLQRDLSEAVAFSLSVNRYPYAGMLCALMLSRFVPSERRGHLTRLVHKTAILTGHSDLATIATFYQTLDLDSLTPILGRCPSQLAERVQMWARVDAHVFDRRDPGIPAWGALLRLA